MSEERQHPTTGQGTGPMAEAFGEIDRLKAEISALMDLAVCYWGPKHGWQHRVTGTCYPTKAEAVAAHRRAAGLDKGESG